MLAVNLFYCPEKTYATETYICIESPYRCIILTDGESIDLIDFDYEKILGAESDDDIAFDDL